MFLFYLFLVSIRLADGHFSNQGRVEVSVNGLWGQVCDDSFGKEEAKVACSMLGLPPPYSGSTIYLKGSKYSEDSKPVWMSGIRCYGWEQSLLACNYELGYGDKSPYCRGLWRRAGLICGGTQGQFVVSYQLIFSILVVGEYEWGN